jgi:multiple sugar transport system substrate-binding protein
MNLPTMKPFQIVILVIFGFLGILGLVLFANYGGFSGESTKVGTVAIWGTLPQDQMQTVLNALSNQNQEFTGVSYQQHQESSFDNELNAAIATGKGPDLILISQEMLETEQGKLSVIPFSVISQRAYLDRYLPITELFLATDGTYGIPFAVDPLVLYYNRRMLIDANAAVPPSSWEAVTSLTQQITQSAAGTVAKSSIPFGVYENVENARAIVSLLLLQAGSPIASVSQSGLRATLSEGNASVEPALTFYTQFADPVKTVYTWNRAISSARQAFLGGTLAFYPGFASELPALTAANPNLDFDMTAIPQPQTATQRLTYGKAYAFAVPKSSPNGSGAVTAAIALADASLAPAVSSALSMAPALRASLTPSSNDRFSPVYYPQALIAQGWLSPSPSETDRIFGTMISNITSGRMSIAQALSTANQAINAAF